MGSLVDSDDLADWLGVTTVSTDRAELLLELASDLVRTELDQVIDYVADDEVELIARGANVLLLPELPVWEVASVETEDDAGEVTALVEGTDYRLEAGPDHRLGILRRLPSRAGWRDGLTVRVTYSHGYGTISSTGESVDSLPGAIKAAVLRVGARAYTNPSGVRQETIGRYSYTAGGETPGLVLTAGDKHDLDRFYPGHRAGAK